MTDFHSQLWNFIEDKQTPFTLKLLKQCADKSIEFQCKNGTTPLLLAIETKQTEIALKLIEKSTYKSLNMLNRQGLNALIYAIKKNEKRVAFNLIEKNMCEIDREILNRGN